MKITEKVAYLKGMAEGMKMDDSTNEGKLILAMLDVLNEVAQSLEDIDETFDDFAEVVNDIEESVYEIEDEVFGDDIDYDDYEDFEEDLYQINCPKCDTSITVDFDILDSGSVICPECGEKCEFDLEILDKEDGDCGCGHDH